MLSLLELLRTLSKPAALPSSVDLIRLRAPTWFISVAIGGSIYVDPIMSDYSSFQGPNLMPITPALLERDSFGTSSSGGDTPSYGSSRSDGNVAASLNKVITEGMERDLFIESIKRSRDRMRHCRSVPFSVLMYALFITDICLHGTVGTAYDLEQGLRDTFGGGTTYPFPDGLSRPTDWYGWVTGTFLPTALPDTDADGNPYPAWARGRLGGTSANLIVGGVRLSTRRVPPAACSLPSDLAALYGGGCRSDVNSAGPDFTPYGNLVIAEAAGVASAFSPSDAYAVTDPSGKAFQIFLDQRLPTDPDLTGMVGGLAAAGWLDNATSAVSLQFALLNGENGMVARVGITAAFSRGGRVSSDLQVSSVLLEPYFGPLAGLVALDLLMLGYWCYLLWGTCRRVGGALCGKGGAGRPRAGAGCCSWTGYRVGRLCSYWRLLDVATTVSMLTTFSIWLALLARLRSLQSTMVSNLKPDIAAVASFINQDVFTAADLFASAKTAAVVTLLLLTLRLFKYFKYQVRGCLMAPQAAMPQF